MNPEGLLVLFYIANVRRRDGDLNFLFYIASIPDFSRWEIIYFKSLAALISRLSLFILAYLQSTVPYSSPRSHKATSRVVCQSP